MDVDPVWEYNAPQFVDFSNPMDDPGVDKYFDGSSHGTEEQAALNVVNCSSVHNSDDATMNYCVDVQSEEPKTTQGDGVNLSGKSFEPEGKFVSSSLEKQQHAGVPTEIGNGGEAVSSGDGGKTEPGQPEMQNTKDSRLEGDGKEDSAEKRSEIRACRPRARSFNLAQSVHKDSARKVSESTRRGSESQEPPRTETGGKATAATRRRSRSQDRADRPSSPSVIGKKTYAGKLTMPQTPSFMKRELKFLHMNPVKPTEDQEMDRIRMLRQALVEKRKLAAESRVVALSSAGYAPVRSRQPVTRPQEFKFASDDRLKGPAADGGPTSTWKELDFAAELRKPIDQKTTASSGITVPVPFNLHPSRKRYSSDDNLHSKEEKFETMAEKVIKFTSKTPDRFRMRPANDRRSADYQMKHSEQEPHKLTVPKTPNLATKSRARSIDVQSQAEKEEMELKQIKENKFKALPLNPKIFENPKLGVKPVAPKASTKPEPFDLEIDRRVQQRKRHNSESLDDQHHEFHAQPVPKKMLLGPVGIHPAKEIPLTVPQSPAFASKLRSTVKPEEPKVEKAQNIVRALPVPHVGIPFQPKLDHQATVVVPFSFEQRTKEMHDKKEQKIKSVLEQEKKGREFHAQPLKDLQPVLPEKKARPATVPEPFNLEIETRCAARIEDWKQKVQEDENKQKMAACFKANPPSVLEKEPFAPAKSSKPLTEVTDVQLNTEKRAEKRQEWEAWNNDKQTLLELERKREEKAKLEEAQKEVQRMREEAVQKANPIRHYKEVHIVPSDQPLTNPESPRFSERLKGKALRH